jgi:hypothetical protein
MSNPSTIFLLKLQELGENLNTWGLAAGLNGVIQQLEDAIGGVEEISLTGNKTLSRSNYTTGNEFTPRFQVFSDGGLSAAPTITIPAVQSWFLVVNGTDYAITYSNGSNTASVSANQMGFVYTNGTTVLSQDLFESGDQTYPGGLSYLFSTTTTNADPGSGYLRLDNATQASATGIYINDADANGADVSAWLLSWDNSTSTVPCRIILRSKSTPANFHIYALASSITDNAGYMDMTVTYVDGNGSLANGEAITITPVFNGDKVDTGATGPAGTVTTAGDPTTPTSVGNYALTTGVAFALAN